MISIEEGFEKNRASIIKRVSLLREKVLMVTISFLHLTVPPSSPIIYDGSDEEVVSAIGPLVEGSDVLLKCRVRGGKRYGKFIFNFVCAKQRMCSAFTTFFTSTSPPSYFFILSTTLIVSTGGKAEDSVFKRE